MHALKEQISLAVRGRNPLIYLFSPEEDRPLRLVQSVADEFGNTPMPVIEWTCTDGLQGFAAKEESCDPAAALKIIAGRGENAFFVMKDLSEFMHRADVARGLRDIYYQCKGQTGLCVFIISPTLCIPEALKREINLIDCPPPDDTEILDIVTKVLADHPGFSLPKEEIQAVIPALKGLTLSETEHILHRVFTAELAGTQAILAEIFAEKSLLVRKSGYLEFTPPQATAADIGGLDVLKDWLEKRRPLFTKQALAAGIPAPKGLLIMGVSGCGKSLAVKAISSLWNVPMFRLDMNLVFSGMFGNPEAAFHRVLQTIESVAPAVLWIDEIEMALNLDEAGVGMNAHIISSFLTWMQEKPQLVFVAATANRIEALPAEIIRKGRFDEVFFVDLPNAKEVEQILRIHLLRNGTNPDDFDFEMLTVMMEDWNGAEIEQAVISARTSAFQENRPFTNRDLTATVGRMVPLARTMEEQIKKIRKWALSRATPASKYGRTIRR